MPIVIAIGIFAFIHFKIFLTRCFLNRFVFYICAKYGVVKKCVLFVCLMLSAVGFCQEWNTELEVAKSKAVAQNKNILLVFSGSDWCARCIELEKKVWQNPEFKAEAEKNWVLLRADFLQKKGEADPVDINDPKIILAERYNRNGFFPYIVLLDKYGRVIERGGYEEFSTAKEYIEYFKKLGKK